MFRYLTSPKSTHYHALNKLFLSPSSFLGSHSWNPKEYLANPILLFWLWVKVHFLISLCPLFPIFVPLLESAHKNIKCWIRWIKQIIEISVIPLPLHHTVCSLVTKFQQNNCYVKKWCHKQIKKVSNQLTCLCSMHQPYCTHEQSLSLLYQLLSVDPQQQVMVSFSVYWKNIKNDSFHMILLYMCQLVR